MKAGRNLDALIAEKVMGWDRCDIFKYVDMGSEQGFVRASDVPFNAVPHYSTDIAAAWEVLVKATSDYSDGTVEESLVFFSSNPTQMPHWECEIRNSESTIRAKADTAPHAICLAALKAVGFLQPEETS